LAVTQHEFDREDEEEDEESPGSQLQRLYLLSAISLLRGKYILFYYYSLSFSFFLLLLLSLSL
jgi:hypothetical protein